MKLSDLLNLPAFKEDAPEKSCGHPHHPEDGNVGSIPVGGKTQVLRGEDVEYNRKNPVWFIGKFCKLGFPVLGTKDKKEYMWVHVDTVVDDELNGKLANTPICPSEFGHGDTIGFKTSEILDVMETDDP